MFAIFKNYDIISFVVTLSDGVSPSGKALDSDSSIPQVRILLPQPFNKNNFIKQILMKQQLWVKIHILPAGVAQW